MQISKLIRYLFIVPIAQVQPTIIFVQYIVYKITILL